MIDITDNQIEFIKSNPEGFSLVYQRYVKEIHSYSYLLTRNRHKAEDLTSHTFLKAFEKIEKFNGNAAQLRAWLYTITRNSFIDSVRKKSSKEINIEFMSNIPDRDSMEGPQDISIMFNNLLESINVLEPEIYKEVLILKYKQGLENKEIAEILDKSESNIRTIVHRAIEKLKKNVVGHNINPNQPNGKLNLAQNF